MSIVKVLVLGATLVAFTACSNNYLPYPRATMFPNAEQPKLQSANHWNVLARHESELILRNLGDGGGAITPSLYLGDAPGTASDFETAYHNMLMSALVQNGADIMLSRENALFTLDYDVQVIQHHNRKRLPLRPGTATAFFAAIAGANDTQYWGDQGLILIPVAFAADLWNKFRKDTSAEVTEVIITTRVLSSQRVAHSESRVYYFNPEDIGQYRGQGKTFNVVSARGN